MIEDHLSIFNTDIDPVGDSIDVSSGPDSIEVSPGPDFRKPGRPGSSHDFSYV